MAGFNLDSPLVCEGIIGDGCGGGRIFYIEDSTLKAYDPISEESIILLQDIVDALSIKKNACVISIECTNKNIAFDLSLMRLREESL